MSKDAPKPELLSVRRGLPCAYCGHRGGLVYRLYMVGPYKRFRYWACFRCKRILLNLGTLVLTKEETLDWFERMYGRVVRPRIQEGRALAWAHRQMHPTNPLLTERPHPIHPG